MILFRGRIMITATKARNIFIAEIFSAGNIILNAGYV